MAKQQHLVAMVGSDTVIGTGVQVEGALGSAGDITVDGHVQGDVTAGGNITIGVNGEVTGNLATSGKIVLWLRDVSLGEPVQSIRGGLPAGTNLLLAIHCRTGQVTAHPLNETTNTTTGDLTDPYQYVRDGKSSVTE